MCPLNDIISNLLHDGHSIHPSSTDSIVPVPYRNFLNYSLLKINQKNKNFIYTYKLTNCAFAKLMAQHSFTFSQIYCTTDDDLVHMKNVFLIDEMD